MFGTQLRKIFRVKSRFQLEVRKMQASNDSASTPKADASPGTDEVVAVANGFQASFYVASAFYRFIIGARGTTKAGIESATGAKIMIPRQGSGNIEILGKNAEIVRAAREEIEKVMSSSRNKLSVSHFTDVRVTNEGIVGNYERFMREILQGPPVDGLTEAMFMRPIKLHLTFNVMTLLDDSDFARATQLLNDCVEKVIVPAKKQFGTIAMKVSGVSIFKDEHPKKVKVLFGRIESESLQQIANGIMEYFIAEGASKRERGESSVKMHMTLINTRYDKGQKEKDGNGNATPRHRYREKKTFDATSILEKYADYDFGSQEVTEILLSSMSEKDSEGFYKTIASVKV